MTRREPGKQANWPGSRQKKKSSYFREGKETMHFKRAKAVIAATGAVVAMMAAGVPAFAATPGDTLTVTAGSGLNVRSGHGTNTAIKTCLYNGTGVTCLEDDGSGWIRIMTPGGTTGYVCSAYVSDEKSAESSNVFASPEASVVQTSYSTSSQGQAVADYAMQFLGLPYVWGGESLTTGADCSGFTKAVYSHFGIWLPHYDLSQRAYGRSVASIYEAQPGDLIFYPGHVGIYIGGGQAISARNPEYGVAVTNADYLPVEAIRRIF